VTTSSSKSSASCTLRLADQRVMTMLELAQGLLDDHGDHVAACRRIPEV